MQFTRTTHEIKTRRSLKARANMCPTDQEKAGVSVFISPKVDFRQSHVRDDERSFITIKGGRNRKRQRG